MDEVAKYLMESLHPKPTIWIRVGRLLRWPKWYVVTVVSTSYILERLYRWTKRLMRKIVNLYYYLGLN